MVSLAFCLSVVGTVIFLLCAFLTVVIHSFVADSIVYWTLVIWWWGRGVPTLCLQGVGGPHLMLAGRQPFGVLRWFRLFCFFHLVSAVCFLTTFRLPPAFAVWSFFHCHRHLWSVLSFFATGICVQPLSFTAFSAVGLRVRPFVFAF